MKKLAIILIAAFALVAGSVYIYHTSYADENAEANPQVINQNNQVESNESPSVSGIEVNAYYFHATHRCPTCRKIEAYSQEAIETGFADELSGGKLKWASIDFDKSENTHYKKDYRLFASALVIVKIVDGKQTDWKNLDKIWEYNGDKAKFTGYVQNEIRGYLENN